MALSPAGAPAIGPARTWSGRRAAGFAAGAAALAVFIGVGLVGVEHYARNYWVYRGFPPPRDPAFVHERGTLRSFDLYSAAIGRSRRVYVYLPAGYATHPHRRYPVFYLLHGFPGRPPAFIDTVRAGVVDDIIAAKHSAQPLILAMPFGSTGTFTDKEWANGVRPHEAWATFVARDVVHAMDSRFRTIAAPAGRALGGLSEGGYGALNIGLQNAGEFRVLESWSGYALADNLPAVFGGSRVRLAANSPALELRHAAPALRRAGTYVWLYSGSTDPLRHQNAAFAAALGRAGIRHRWFLVRGGHNWALWRGEAANALIAAARRLAHG